jgi:putative hemolysin
VEHQGGAGVVLDGRLSIGEASQAIGLPLPEGEYDSVAGLLYSRLGIVSKPGDELRLGDVTLVVDELDGHRITRVRAMRTQESASGEREGREHGSDAGDGGQR